MATTANKMLTSKTDIVGDMPIDFPGDVNENQCWLMPNLKNVCWKLYTYTAGSIPFPNWHKCCADQTEGEPLLHEQDEEIKIRRKLKFHFMNPLQKWRYKKSGRCLSRYPFSLFCQILAICLVTIQVKLFGDSRFALTQFILNNEVTINSLFLDFDNEDSKMHMVHSIADLYHQIQRIADTYYNIQNIGVAPYDYIEDPNAIHPDDPPLLHVSVLQYNEWRFDASCHDIHLSHGTHTFDIPLYSSKNETCYHPDNCTIQSQLAPHVNASSIGSIKTLSVHFKLTSFFIDQQMKVQYISCVTFDIVIVFDNTAVSGAIPVEVTTKPTVFDCNANQKNDQFYEDVFRQYVALDICVLVTVLVYSFLILCSIIDSCRLTRSTFKFFRSRHKLLTWRHIMSLQNFWLYGMVVGNSLVTVGTALKITLAFKGDVLYVKLEDCTALILGLGVFCQWCGLLHFLSYFESYNILLITLRIAFPSVVRLVVCAGVLYIAFMFLGWLVLGPYHPKFADLSITSECLFSLLNGDDMFATYKEMTQTSQALWIFSKIYLYIFIALFIYVVLSVFIGLITVTYETLIEHWHSRSKGFLHEFAQNGMEHLEKRMNTMQTGRTGDGGCNCEVGNERGNRQRGSRGNTDGGYGGCHSNNRDKSTTVNNEVHGRASSTVRNYGSIIPSSSNSLQATPAAYHTTAHHSPDSHASWTGNSSTATAELAAVV